MLLAWTMEWGPYETQLKAIEGKTTGEISALKRKPILTAELILLWNGFLRLHSARHASETANPISLSDIHAWFMMNGILDIEDMLDIDFLFQHMDAEWLTKQRHKDKPE